LRYDQFKEVWTVELRKSGLRTLGIEPNETLDLRSMGRTYEVFVEPAGHQDAEPFFVSASLSWTWGPVQAARTYTTEEDLLRQLLGDEEQDQANTERPWLRVDIALKASLMYGKGIPLPPRQIWTSWAREVAGRLERIEPLLPDEVVEESPGGALAITAWKGDPSLDVECTAEGELKLNSVEQAAWQAINLPRVWSDQDREPDEDPGAQLAAMFKRVRSALNAWMESLDHLARAPRSSK
jgi:hypothetical protein